MNEQFSRTKALIGEAALEKLASSHIALFGLGGVGSYAAEALARAGVGELTLVDGDRIAPSNINRQLYALHSTLGKFKTQTAKNRIHDIAPDCKVNEKTFFYLPENGEEFFSQKFDYVVDAIDMVSAKIDIAVRCGEKGIPLISCMGTGNKLDPTAFEVADIYSTEVCPLCRVMRRELRKRGVEKLKVVYSREVPFVSGMRDETGRAAPASISFVPPVAGMILAGEVIKDIISGEPDL